MKFQLRPHQVQMLDATFSNDKGTIVCPTGGGKTLIEIENARRFLTPGKVVLQVSPQHVLSKQIFREFSYHLEDVNFMWRQISSEPETIHRRSQGFKNFAFREVPPNSPTTNPSEIRSEVERARVLGMPLILFCTYASLKKVVESGIEIECTNFDEAHHCVASDVFPQIQKLKSNHTYFYTATPKYSEGETIRSAGMQNLEVYGGRICTVPFDELVKNNVIVTPRIHVQKSNVSSDEVGSISAAKKAIVETVKHYEENFFNVENHKILFCCDGTKTIQGLINEGLPQWAKNRGYKVLSIDSVNNGYCDGDRNIGKRQFLELLRDLGSDPSQKLIVLHHSMLSEGVDVPGMSGVVFLRNSVDMIFAVQAIGRVLRTDKNNPQKNYGVVTIVQHDDQIEQVEEMVTSITTSLLKNGIPPRAEFNEIDGRSKEEEILEDIDFEDFDPEWVMNVAIANWEHSMRLEELTQSVRESGTDSLLAIADR